MAAADTEGIDHAAKAFYTGTAHLKNGLLAGPKLQEGHRRVGSSTYRSLLVKRADTRYESVANFSAALHIDAHPPLRTHRHSHGLATMADAHRQFRMVRQIGRPFVIVFHNNFTACQFFQQAISSGTLIGKGTPLAAFHSPLYAFHL